MKIDVRSLQKNSYASNKRILPNLGGGVTQKGGIGGGISRSHKMSTSDAASSGFMDNYSYV